MVQLLSSAYTSYRQKERFEQEMPPTETTADPNLKPMVSSTLAPTASSILPSTDCLDCPKETDMLKHLDQCSKCQLKMYVLINQKTHSFITFVLLAVLIYMLLKK